MAQEPGVRRSGKPKREWNVVTGLPVKQANNAFDRASVWTDKTLRNVEGAWERAAVRTDKLLPGTPIAERPVGPRTSVTRVKTPMSPTFHLLMTLLTGGAWLLFLVPYMIIHAMSPGRRVKTTYR